ncbi:MAG TPA: hypothetical protein DDY79_06995 [Brevundimonas sp.]|uniref:hypothetical protein n=1 Tax=Brevundimonas sp. TaxID=1871086 RepID=UPI000E9565FE|nr:hypothetical protein [Brevundimonas sp.]HBI19050.1 hypothetical protein [Brevundimonas sp.]
MARSYEEIRSAVIAVLLAERDSYDRIEQWESLKSAVATELGRRAGDQHVGYPPPNLAAPDAELVRDVFWDLFRQGHITLGSNNSNPTWPWFRLSHFGETALRGADPYTFTDTASYLDMVRAQVETLDATTETYLSEAVRAFYANCLLSSVVMLGVAAEARFLHMLDVAVRSSNLGSVFKPVDEERSLLRKINRFQNLLAPHRKGLGAAGEDLEVNLNFIQSVIRTSRKEAGHAIGKPADRAQTYVLLQLFAPFARKLEQLEAAFD